MPSLAAIAAAVVLFGGGVVALVMALRRPGETPALAPSPWDEPAESAPRRQHGPEVDPSPLISRQLARMGIARKMQRQILQAGLLLRPSEVVVFSLCAGATGFMLGLLLHKPLVAPLLACAAGALPAAYVNLRTGARRKKLVDQLGEALSMMASSLRSGYSFMRAMQVVRDEMDAPISQEFGRVLDEVNVGVSHERALQHLLDRCPSGDMELVVTACQIQATVGGNLAEILDTTASMIRERCRLQGEINALTAEGRLSAGILIALPIVLAGVVGRLSPGYLDPLVDTMMGKLILFGALCSMMMGVLIIKKMLAVKI